MLHALVITKGFKVENHICLGYYLRDVMKREDLYRIFDSCRKDRNSLVYYGNLLDPGIAEENIKKMDIFMDEIERLI
jgi:hypothetical protein